VYQASICKPVTLRHFSFNTSWALEIVRTRTAEKVTLVPHSETHQQSVFGFVKNNYLSFVLQRKIVGDSFIVSCAFFKNTTAFAQS